MERKFILISVLAILLMSLFFAAFRVEKVQAGGTIYIKADGSIDPPTANITTTDNVTYTFTENNYHSIFIGKNDIVVNGAGYSLLGSGSGIGFNLHSTENVTIKNTCIENFFDGILLSNSSFNVFHNNIIIGNFPESTGGIRLENSSYNNVSKNTIDENWGAIYLTSSADHNIISDNNLINSAIGLYIYGSPYNIVCGNVIANNYWGLRLEASKNVIYSNVIENNSRGIAVGDSLNNSIYHNNFEYNSWQAYHLYGTTIDIWDNGCEGNFWSDYNGTDLDGDGIGDTPYVIDENNTDNYPLMNPYWNTADINHDLTVDIFDVVLACQAYLSTPSDPHWNCHSDVAEPYGIINIFDVVMICSSYGEEY